MNAVPGASADKRNGDEIPEIVVEVGSYNILSCVLHILIDTTVAQLQSAQWRE